MHPNIINNSCSWIINEICEKRVLKTKINLVFSQQCWRFAPSLWAPPRGVPASQVWMMQKLFFLQFYQISASNFLSFGVYLSSNGSVLRILENYLGVGSTGLKKNHIFEFLSGPPQIKELCILTSKSIFFLKLVKNSGVGAILKFRGWKIAENTHFRCANSLFGQLGGFYDPSGPLHGHGS